MATKLLLVEDVEDLGRKGEIASVRPGFARNYLLPKGLAILADKRALRLQAKLQEEREKKALEDRKESEAFAKQIDGQTLTTIVKVDQEGHLYGSVSLLDIVHLVEEHLRITLDKRFIQLKHPIKKLGVFPIALKLHEGVECTFTIKVESELEENAS